MRRVVVTGMGLVSCLGNDKQSVTESLREGRSGITFNEDFKAMGLRSHVSGSVDIDLKEHIDRKHLRFMGDAASYAYVAMQKAIEDAGLSEEQVSNPRTGLIAGSGGASSANIVLSADKLRERGVRRLGPYIVPKTMSSTVSACLSTHFGIKGLNYSVTSACATSTHCIGSAMEQIQWGKQDMIFAGGGEENHWSLAMMFDGMGALSTHYNDDPAQPHVLMTPSVMVSSLPVAAACWYLKSWNMQKHVVQKFMPRWLVMVQPQMVTTWSHPRVKVLSVACSRPSPRLIHRLITLIPTAPVHRWAILPNLTPCAKCSVVQHRHSVQANPCADTRWVLQVYRKRSIAC